ncbi:hypothetical protein GCM10009536_08380 [Streptomyces thermocarboxydus]
MQTFPTGANGLAADNGTAPRKPGRVPSQPTVTGAAGNGPLSAERLHRGSGRRRPVSRPPGPTKAFVPMFLNPRPLAAPPTRGAAGGLSAFPGVRTGMAHCPAAPVRCHA